MKNCNYCGGENLRTNPRAIYCSRSCKSKADNANRQTAEYRREAMLKNRYGISQNDYERMETEQDSKCAICGTADSGRDVWCVDHDHSTGQVRGLLCHSCNVALGLFKDNPDTLVAAAFYVSRHEAVNV